MVDYTDIREDDIFLTDIFEDVKTDQTVNIYQNQHVNDDETFFERYE